MVAEGIGQFPVHEVVVGVVDDFGFGGTEEAGEGDIAAQVDAVRVLQPDEVGDRLHQSLVADLALAEGRLCPFVLRDVQDHHDARAESAVRVPDRGGIGPYHPLFSVVPVDDDVAAAGFTVADGTGQGVLACRIGLAIRLGELPRGRRVPGAHPIDQFLGRAATDIQGSLVHEADGAVGGIGDDDACLAGRESG